MLGFVQAHWLSLTYGAGAFAVLAFSWALGGRAAVLMGAMLCACWLGFNALAWTLPTPLAWAPLPLMDLGCLLLALAAARAYGVVWPLVLVSLFMVQLGLHVAFWWNWLQLPPDGAQRAARGLKHSYSLWLNLTFIAQLACVAWPGALNVFGTVGSWARPGVLSDRGGGA